MTTTPAAVVAASPVDGDLRRAFGSYAEHTLRQWHEALRETEQQAASAYGPQRDELVALAGGLRFALAAFERNCATPMPGLADRRGDELSWAAISQETARDEAAGGALWQRVRGQARDEQANGRTAALAVEGAGAGPWDRAQYLALRDALADGLQPRDGLELALLDGMAQALTLHRQWTAKLVLTESLDVERTRRDADRYGTWQPPRLTEAQAVDRAAAMADRAMRTFLRLLKAYRDGRRVLGSLTVAGGQVNIAGQQLVANAPMPTGKGERR